MKYPPGSLRYHTQEDTYAPTYSRYNLYVSSSRHCVWVPALILLDMPCPGQATARSSSNRLPGPEHFRFSPKHLRAPITTWQSRLVYVREPGDDGSNCQVKVGHSHEMNRTLNLQYLSQCYLSPFSHAWPAHPSYLLSCKVSASNTISGSPFPLHHAGLLHLSHQVYTMPSRPPNSPFISTIHSLPYLNPLRDIHHRIGCSSPSFLRRNDSRRCFITNSLVPEACSCLAPRSRDPLLFSASCLAHRFPHLGPWRMLPQ